MPPRTKKTTEPAVAPEPVVEPVVEPVAPAGDEPAPVEAPAEDLTDDRQPGTASLEAPEAPAPVVDEVAASALEISNGALAASLIENSVPTRVLIDYATGKPVTADEVFELEFPYGTSLLCKVQLTERLQLPGVTDPIDRLVLSAGSRVTSTMAERIGLQLAEQEASAAAAEPADVVEG